MQNDQEDIGPPSYLELFTRLEQFLMNELEHLKKDMQELDRTEEQHLILVQDQLQREELRAEYNSTRKHGLQQMIQHATRELERVFMPAARE
eukprot:766914-Hanusia_phi.AAC.5